MVGLSCPRCALTPFPHLPPSHAHSKRVQVLLEGGADPNGRPGTPAEDLEAPLLHHLDSGSDKRVIRALVMCPDTDLNETTTNGSSPATVAADARLYGIAQLIRREVGSCGTRCVMFLDDLAA